VVRQGLAVVKLHSAAFVVRQRSTIEWGAVLVLSARSHREGRGEVSPEKDLALSAIDMTHGIVAMRIKKREDLRPSAFLNSRSALAH
jgi:hypothetical protein